MLQVSMVHKGQNYHLKYIKFGLHLRYMLVVLCISNVAEAGKDCTIDLCITPWKTGSA